MRAYLPAAVRNPYSLLGVAVATAMAVVFVILAVLQFTGYLTNPYIGLLVFVAVPALFVAGLLLIPFGIWRSARRRRLHPAAPEWPVIDLRQARQRTILTAALVLTIVNVVIVSLAAYGGVHAMESVEFCGQVCHTTMEPQYAAHQVFPHARVACTECHVGPGAGAFAAAKLAGTRQLFHVIANRVPKPVPPPPDLIRTARETCEGCHWPETFRGDQTRVIREYANDEASTETATTLRLHIGGGSRALGVGSGIHWHMNLDNRIDFIASDPPSPGASAGQAVEGTIPYVRLTDRQGNVREYFAEGFTADQIRGIPTRRMDCMDCHNRPAHSFFFTPERAIDTAIVQGRIPRGLRFARREAVAAVRETYADRAAALEGIAERLTGFYASREGADAPLVRRLVAATQEVWSRNVFPAASRNRSLNWSAVRLTCCCNAGSSTTRKSEPSG